VRPYTQYYNGSVGVVTRLQEWWLNSRRDIHTPQNVQTCSGGTSGILLYGYWDTLCWGAGKIGRGVMLNSYVHLVPRLSADIPLHPKYVFWHAKVKFTLEQTTKAQRYGRDIAVYFL
jgi:hypothetical protein